MTIQKISIAFSVSIAINLTSITSVHATTIYESGTLGQTGITFQELFDQVVPGTNVTSGIFVGARFEIQNTGVTTRVGGHFIGANAGDTIFGALVALTSASDLPDSFELNTPDVLGSTIIQLPTTSNDVYGTLELTLDPGWYAVVFGSGLFGAEGIAAATRNNLDVSTPSYISRQRTAGGWREQSSIFFNHRYVVEGVIVPEPSTLALITFGLLTLQLHKHQRSRCGGVDASCHGGGGDFGLTCRQGQVDSRFAVLPARRSSPTANGG